MPGQWEYQIGPVGPLELGDEVMISRWLLHRLGEWRALVVWHAREGGGFSAMTLWVRLWVMSHDHSLAAAQAG
jgi:hypothetical protein